MNYDSLELGFNPGDGLNLGYYNIFINYGNKPYYGQFGPYDYLMNALEVRIFSAKIYTKDSLCIRNPVLFSDSSVNDSFGIINNWKWDFGDGYSDTIQNPQHKYSKEGYYKVTLKIKSTAGLEDSSSKLICVSNLPKAAFFLPDSGCINSVFLFKNNSTVCSGTFKSFWSFDDGFNDSSINTTHQFTKETYHKVILKITSQGGNSDSIVKSIYVNAAPKAAISSPDSACMNSSVQFLEPSSADYYLWDFGDGNTSSLRHPKHVYTKAGVYDVKSIISYKGGCSDTMIKTIAITSLPIITWKLTNPKARDIDFAALNSSFKSYLWDFGDSVTSTNFHQLHTYKKDGTYDVKLIVEDSVGCSLEKDTQITVTNTSLNSKSEINSLHISPNPFSSSFNIAFNLSSTQQTKIQLCSLDGRVIKEVYNGILKEGKNELQVDCPFASGVYILRLVTKEGVMNSRVVKME